MKRFLYFSAVFAWCFVMLYWSITASAQSFFKSVHLVETPTTQATSGGTTTLTLASQTVQRFTGASNQTVVLPAATTLSLGMYYLIINNSTGVLTIQDGGTNTLVTCKAGDTYSFRLIPARS